MFRPALLSSAHGPLTSRKWICFGCSGISSVTTPWLSSHFTETFMVWPVALTFRQSGWLFFLTSQMRLKFTSPSRVAVKCMWTGNLVRKHICWVELALWAWDLSACQNPGSDWADFWASALAAHDVPPVGSLFFGVFTLFELLLTTQVGWDKQPYKLDKWIN